MQGFGEVHRGFEIGQIHHYGGVRLMNWAVGKGLHLMNTCFEKRKNNIFITKMKNNDT